MKKVVVMLSLVSLLFTALLAIVPVSPVLAQGASGASTPTPPAPSPLFAPQDEKYRFTLTLPKLGFHFPSDENLLSRVIDFTISVLTTIVGAVAFGYIIYGGILYMTAGGDPARVDMARKTLIGAIIGIFIATLAYVIVQYTIYTLTSAL